MYCKTYMTQEEIEQIVSRLVETGILKNKNIPEINTASFSSGTTDLADSNECSYIKSCYTWSALRRQAVVKHSRRAARTTAFDAKYIVRLLFYHSQKGRTILHIAVASDRWEPDVIDQPDG